MTTPPSRRRPPQQRSRAQWQDLMAKFHESGQSISVFCQREAITKSSFYHWRAQLANTALPSSSDTDSAFVDIGPLTTTPARAERLERRLDLGAGLTLTLVRG